MNNIGEISQISLAIILTVFIVSLASLAAYDMKNSTDTSAANFITYNQNSNLSAEVGSGLNITNTTRNTQENFKLIAMGIKQNLAEGKNSLQTGNLIDAFGAVTKLTLNVAYLLYTVVVEGVNVITGFGTNIEQFPSPWKYLSIVYDLVLVLFLIFITLKIVGIVTGREV